MGIVWQQLPDLNECLSIIVFSNAGYSRKTMVDGEIYSKKLTCCLDSFVPSIFGIIVMLSIFWATTDSQDRIPDRLNLSSNNSIRKVGCLHKRKCRWYHHVLEITYFTYKISSLKSIFKQELHQKSASNRYYLHYRSVLLELILVYDMVTSACGWWMIRPVWVGFLMIFNASIR